MEQKNDLDFILRNLLAGGKCIIKNDLFKVSFFTNNLSMTRYKSYNKIGRSLYYISFNAVAVKKLDTLAPSHLSNTMGCAGAAAASSIRSWANIYKY